MNVVEWFVFRVCIDTDNGVVIIGVIIVKFVIFFEMFFNNVLNASERYFVVFG